MGLKASEGEQVHICCIFLIDIGKSINKQNCGVSCPRNTLENDMVTIGWSPVARLTDHHASGRQLNPPRLQETSRFNGKTT
jgi:hypothetical protein